MDGDLCHGKRRAPQALAKYRTHFLVLSDRVSPQERSPACRLAKISPGLKIARICAAKIVGRECKLSGELQSLLGSETKGSEMSHPEILRAGSDIVANLPQL